MHSVAGQADAEGRYRINPRPGIRFGINAYAPRHALSRPANSAGQGDRLAARRSGQKSRHKLPRRRAGHGTVVEAGTGQPVAGASVQYVPGGQQSQAPRTF